VVNYGFAALVDLDRVEVKHNVDEEHHRDQLVALVEEWDVNLVWLRYLEGQEERQQDNHEND